MKKITLAFALIGLLMVAAPLLSLAQPAYIPHEDPSLARAMPDLTTLLIFYGSSFLMAASGNYQGAHNLLNDLSQARVPDELTILANRFRVLARSLFGKMDRIDRLLDEAEALVSANQLSDACLTLDAAAAEIGEVRSLVSDINATAKVVEETLKTIPGVILRDIEPTYVRLAQGLSQLSALLDELDRRQKIIAASQESQAMKLLPTTLTLQVDRAAVYVGEGITASGRLSAKGDLSEREVFLQLGSEKVKTVTSADGAFTAEVKIPYIYVGQMTLRAIFTPKGSDTATYLATESLPIAISTSYYPTKLEFSIPEKTHPGFPTSITGQLSTTDGGLERTLQTFLSGNLIAVKQITEQFDFEFTPPADIKPGKHWLTLSVLPQERYAGAMAESAVEVVKIPTEAEIVTPRLLVSLWEADLSGQVTSGGRPIPDAGITIRMGEATTSVRTAADGAFSARVKTPFKLSLAGPQEISVEIAPSQPWYESLLVRRVAFTINASSLLLILLGVGSLGWLLYRRSRSAVLTVAARPAAAWPTVPQSAPAPPPTLKHQLSGARGTVLSSYFAAVELISKLTGISLSEPMTLREFLRAATSKVAISLKAFAELTALAELTLYSPWQPDAETTAHAEKQANVLKEELRRGTP